MRSVTMREATRRLARRELLLGGFTFLMAVVGLASLAAVAIAGTGAGLRVPGAGANGRAADGAMLVAVGYGDARVAAETATVQILISPSESDMMMSGGGGPMATGDGDPVEARREAALPMVQAIHAAGVAPSDVAVIVSPVFDTSYYGPDDGPFGVRIDVTVRQPSPEAIDRVVNAAGVAAGEHRLRLAEVGVGYGVADCAALERQAREVAIADARAKAEQQAELLRVPLGPLLLSSDVAPEANDDVAPVAGCSTRPPTAPSSPFDPISRLTMPPYEPTDPAEATTRVRISLSFAMSEPT